MNDGENCQRNESCIRNVSEAQIEIREAYQRAKDNCNFNPFSESANAW